MNPVCGIDIAKDEIVATILTDNFKQTRKFGVHTDELFELKKWLKENNCTKAVMESTGVYWAPIYPGFPRYTTMFCFDSLTF
ncbi:MAG: IS110 family transposase [Nitrososphaerota archaeon]|jgi:transposase|nr:IS110 family transposase [Nitrososphaerota archaeon]